jgi:hypothetical protein
MVFVRVARVRPGGRSNVSGGASPAASARQPTDRLGELMSIPAVCSGMSTRQRLECRVDGDPRLRGRGFGALPLRVGLELGQAALSVGRVEPRVDLCRCLRLSGLEQMTVAIERDGHAGVAEDDGEVFDADAARREI